MARNQYVPKAERPNALLFPGDNHQGNSDSTDGEFVPNFDFYLKPLSYKHSVGRFRFSPYGRAEIYYDSRYHKCSRTELTGGSVFPMTKYLELEGYYAHQHDTAKGPNRTVNAVGTVINLYF